jgi:hypothetical protein
MALCQGKQRRGLYMWLAPGIGYHKRCISRSVIAEAARGGTSEPRRWQCADSESSSRDYPVQTDRAGKNWLSRLLSKSDLRFLLVTGPQHRRLGL